MFSGSLAHITFGFTSAMCLDSNTEMFIAQARRIAKRLNYNMASSLFKALLFALALKSACTLD